MEGRSKATYFRIDRLLSQIRASALKSNFNSETFEGLRLYPQYIPENLVVDYNTGHRLNYERS